ncbi:hypothetical protein FB567DRAFT_620959 [Paraphoma chrysanthemicola]|uniref:Transcription factor domain-containing protein n=1 Tax=Paraphoma chrysanthemicola TaxID=798071 RepID=A0A8K0VZ15_9PLEO|nr:hypothetical protein FB567DRAFT_620959 [Paraphoma chrysanthemicola]
MSDSLDLQAGNRKSSGAQTKCPTHFMFIDSSNGGVNAKPDRVVRSFVMKSARNKKSWSTRPKCANTQSHIDKDKRHRKSSRKDSVIELSSLTDVSSQRKCDTTTPVPLECQFVASPDSSRSGSIFSRKSSKWTCESPLSSFASPSTEHWGVGNVFDLSKPRQVQCPSQETFNPSGLGPFDCLVVTLDTRAQRLLHQFVQAASTRLIPLDICRSSENAALSWVSACLQSPIGSPFIYAALTSSCRGAQLNPDTYKWRAMSEINGLLSNSRTNTNDVTIAAVLILLAIEEADLANPKRTGYDRRCSIMVNEAHYNGLKTMIKQRGGLSALGDNKCLQVCLLMHSIAQSITTFKQPYAILADANGHIEDYCYYTNRSPHEFANILQPFRELAIDRVLLKIIFAVTAFTADLASWYDTGTCTMDALDLQKHASLLMYRLLAWYQHNNHERMTGASPMDYLNQSICLAVLIFLVNATEPNAAAFGHRLSKAVSKLRYSLERTPMVAWRNARHVYLWVLTMGALGASSLRERIRRSDTAPQLKYFEQHIKSILLHECPEQPMSMEQLLNTLSTCLWIPSLFDNRLKSLWLSMGLCGYWPVDCEDASSSDGEHAVDEEYALGKSTTMRFFTVDTSVSRRPSSLG